MKVAIQIFGHLRSYKKCYKALHKHLISKYDCDVFMHTWSLTNHSTKTWHKNICKAKPVYGKEDYLKKIYNLKSLKIEEQKQEDLGKFISFKKEISILGIKALFHTMKSVNDLRLNYEKQNKVKYDFVIMVRPDILLKTDFQIDDFIKEVDKELINKSVFTIGFPIFNTLNYFQTIGATDVLFFTKPEILNNIYKNEDKFLSIVENNKDCHFGPEYCFINAVEKSGYKAIFLKYVLKQDFEFKRGLSFKEAITNFVSIRKRQCNLTINICSYLSFPIFKFSFRIFKFQIEFCIGNPC